MWSLGFARFQADDRSVPAPSLQGFDLVAMLSVNYLMGEREPMNDLMAWNADATRMPCTHAFGIFARLFLRQRACRRPLSRSDGHAGRLRDFRGPDLCRRHGMADHIAPWRSVYQINVLAEAEITFLLTNGGHNAGIVSEPGHPHRAYRLATRDATAPYRDPDDWYDAASPIAGSWWPAWQNWLSAHSSGQVSPPTVGTVGYAVLADAPGDYVLVG